MYPHHACHSSFELYIHVVVGFFFVIHLIHITSREARKEQKNEIENEKIGR